MTSARTPIRAWSRRVARCGLVALVLAPFACSVTSGGPSFLRLGVFQKSADGSERSVACVFLPFLGGSQVDSTERVDSPGGSFDVSVNATPEDAVVRFERRGQSVRDEVAIDADTLRAGYSEQVTVPESNGDDTVLRLSSGCDAHHVDGGF